MIEVRTKKPVAVDSPDHLHPWGTAHENSTNHRFNEKVFRLFDERHLRVLDLGCSGGGYVKSMLDDGHDGIGIEGSDYSARMKRAEWCSIPERLFTADVTAPFEVVEDGQPVAFDLITAWELIEHLAESSIPTFCRNILAHLADGGLFIGSINTNPHRDLHQTVKPREWWLRLFAQHGLRNNSKIVEWFQKQFVRGERFAAPGSFHVALSRQGDTNLPSLPRLPIKERLFDMWHFSSPHRIIRAIVLGRK
jgi:cyclopropane fatty-acyl-phospholipid synthase-like methyltransferase